MIASNHNNNNIYMDMIQYLINLKTQNVIFLFASFGVHFDLGISFTFDVQIQRYLHQMKAVDWYFQPLSYYLFY